MSSDPVSLGARVRALRRARAWTLEELAERSAVSRAMLSKIERGETSPTLVVAARESLREEFTRLGVQRILEGQDA